MFRLTAMIVALAICFAAAASADATDCKGLGLRVEADPSYLKLSCEAVRTALMALEDCGLQLPEDLSLEVTDEIEGAPQGCIGRFTCDDNRIEVLSPEALARRTDLTRDYGTIPAERVFGSLVAHELAHAAVFAKSRGTAGLTAQEYVAAVMQLRVMSPEDRAHYLSLQPGSNMIAKEALNPFILALSPGTFNARAWGHYRLEENGCRYVLRLSEGKEKLEIPEF